MAGTTGTSLSDKICCVVIGEVKTTELARILEALFMPRSLGAPRLHACCTTGVQSASLYAEIELVF